MDKRLFGTVIVMVIVIFLAGCAKPGSKSYERRVQKFVDSVYVQSSSTPGALPSGSRIGVLPFECTTPQIGETVSNYTASNLKEGGFVLIDQFEMTQLLKQGNANFIELWNKKDYVGIIRLAKLDYLLVGSVEIASATHKRIMSADAYILDPAGTAAVKAKFTTPKGKITKMPAVGAVLAAAIRDEVSK
ncbi:MAG: hypothetical protein JXR85_10760 [Deltaproteobacteria bacterium]|nr:hypothetical protein [Deltaproteobacteria bacterium]